MRYASVAAAMGLMLGFAPGAFARAGLNVGDQTPANYDAVKKVITETIPDYLEASQCGGWKTDDTVSGKISEVTGVPGRKTQWDGAMLSGMGVRTDANGDGDRDNDYSFPDNAKGLTTACKAGVDRITKTVWRYTGYYNEVEQVQETYAHPYFEDPSCRWRVKNDDGSFSDRAPTVPLENLGDGSPPPSGELDQEPMDRQSPPNCINFCTYVNSYMYVDCVEPMMEYIYDEDGNIVDEFMGCRAMRPSDETKPNMTTHFLCTGQPVDDNAETCQPGAEPTNWPNARSCQGEGCRCDGPGCVNPPSGDAYKSYYRQYDGSYTRDKLEDIDGLNDKNSNTAPVACYGFYNEFDPLHKQTRPEDRRCVINIDVSGYAESQKGKGEYGQNSNLPDRDPNVSANQRINGAFNVDTDLWYMKLSGGFSLLNEKIFLDDFGKDLTNVFLNLDRLDKASMRATEQLTADKPLATSNTVRAFDDTGTGRIVVSWWQKQQTDMAAILHPGVVRILLPAGWAFGADADDPFFQEEKRTVKNTFDSRGERIELQINADEDMLGSAMGYIERSLLLNVEEEPIPVVVPMGSPAEFRALAEQWCMWHVREFNKKNCDDAPKEVKDLMKTLEQYAEDVDKVRILRGELARYAGDIVELQLSITKPIGDWVKKNIDEYKKVLEEQKQIRETYAGQWRDIQTLFNRFNDETNLPWCMNQRYTSPIISMLDEWLISRALNGQISAFLLPKITTAPQEDITIDFSTIAYMTGAIKLPVLQPIQVRITDLPKPPGGTEHGITRTYPTLPSVQAVSDAIRATTANLPKPPQNAPTPPAITVKKMGEEGIQKLASDIAAIRDVINGMNDRYDKFWKSIGPLRPIQNGNDGGRNGIKQMKENLECMSWDSDTCQHVEMDLMERFVRIGSRPFVMLPQDYESRSPIRTFGGPCITENDVCTPMHPENATPKTQWTIYGPSKQNDFIDNLRSTVRSLTLPRPVGGLSSSAAAVYDTDPRHLLPVHDVPDIIDITPRRSSSSASSSSSQ